MKTFLTVFLLALVANTAVSQTQRLTVEKFESNPNDLTAANYPVKDPRNQTCALIIFRNVDVGEFRFNTSGHWSSRQDKTVDGKKEIWLYVAPGTKNITIQNSEINEPHTLSTGRPVVAAKTYIAEIGSIYNRSTQRQYLVIRVNPANASVMVDGQPQVVSNGEVQVQVNLGRHQVSATAPDYHDYFENVEVDDPDHQNFFSLNMRPAFGYLTVGGSDITNDANIFVDNTLIGQGCVTRHKIVSGQHTLTVARSLYNDYSETFTISDDQETILNPSLVANFTSIRLEVGGSPNAQIWLNGRMLGTGSWNGQLERGTYLIETKLAGHEPRNQQVTIDANSHRAPIMLPAPEPIYSVLDIDVSPSGSTILLDGEVKGNTPLRLNQVLIGSHTVTVRREGYSDYVKQVYVERDASNSVIGTLSQNSTLRITTNHNNPEVKINGRHIEPTTSAGSSGKVYVHQGKIGQEVIVEASAYRYHTKTRRIALISAQQNEYIELKTKKRPPHGAYIDLAGSYFGSESGGVGIDFGWFWGGTGINTELEYACNPSEVHIYTYGMRIGYGFRASNRFFITPQIGFRYIEEESHEEYYYSGSYYYYKDYDMIYTGSVGLRLDLRTARYFSFFFAPEINYNFDDITNFNFRIGFTIRMGIGDEYDGYW